MSEVEDWRSLVATNLNGAGYALTNFLLEVGRDIDEDLYKELVERTRQLEGLKQRVNIAMRQYEARHPD